MALRQFNGKLVIVPDGPGDTAPTWEPEKGLEELKDDIHQIRLLLEALFDGESYSSLLGTTYTFTVRKRSPREVPC